MKREDEILDLLPKMEPSEIFRARLLHDARQEAADRSFVARHFGVIAPIAMAASLGIGIFFGNTGRLEMDAVIEGVGLSGAEAESIFSEVDILAGSLADLPI